MNRRVGQLFVITLIAWTLTAFPAKWMWGEGMLLQSAAAMGLCLLPSAAIVALAERMQHRSPEWRLGVTLLGAMVRMGFVLGVGLTLYKTVPSLGEKEFWLWLLAFYLVTLGIEVGLILKAEQAATAHNAAKKDIHGA